MDRPSDRSWLAIAMRRPPHTLSDLDADRCVALLEAYLKRNNLEESHPAFRDHIVMTKMERAKEPPLNMQPFLGAIQHCREQEQPSL